VLVLAVDLVQRKQGAALVRKSALDALSHQRLPSSRSSPASTIR